MGATLSNFDSLGRSTDHKSQHGRRRRRKAPPYFYTQLNQPLNMPLIFPAKHLVERITSRADRRALVFVATTCEVFLETRNKSYEIFGRALASIFVSIRNKCIVRVLIDFKKTFLMEDNLALVTKFTLYGQICKVYLHKMLFCIGIWP